MQVKNLHLFVNLMATCMFLILLLATINYTNCEETIYINEEEDINLQIKLPNLASRYKYVVLNYEVFLIFLILLSINRSYNSCKKR